MVMAASRIPHQWVRHRMSSAPSVTGLNHGLAAGLDTPLSGPSVLAVPSESGPIMVPLSFVVCDPDRKSAEIHITFHLRQMLGRNLVSSYPANGSEVRPAKLRLYT